DPWTLSLADLGAIAMTGSFTGYDPSRFTPERVAEAMQSIHLERLELRYRDASLIDKALVVGAAQMGISAEQLRASVIRQIEATGQQMAAAGPAATAAAHQVAVFLQRPGTLTLSLAPSKPIGMADVAGLAPPALLETIGLTISASQ